MKFSEFLKEFVPEASRKSKQLNRAHWILETTGSPDAAQLTAELDAEFRFLFHNPETYQKLLHWDREFHEPLMKRELNILIRNFKQNQIPKPLLEQIAQKEALLAQNYGAFRPEWEGKRISENDIREGLKNETDPARRKALWRASKEIGAVLAPQILDLVRLRNQAAESLGYSDYFQMQLDLQEVDSRWLSEIFEELSKGSETSYRDALSEIEQRQREQFKTADLGPWAWGEPFCQEDPLDLHELDSIVEGVDIVEAARNFYQKMGIDVRSILARSDLYERAGKNQHAFCIHIDRDGDIRTLNNVKPAIKWLETVLHELGHAIYEMGFDPSLPWLLREPPHMITTEAMALIAGRQAYRSESLSQWISFPKREEIWKKGDRSLRRRQLIFSRWVLVMTAFERELYQNPNRNLNRIWWDCVEKYQKISPFENRDSHFDWASKYHIGLAPVYYFSYLLGEMFASSIQEWLTEKTGKPFLASPEAGRLLNEKLFFPGNRMKWNELVESISGAPLSPGAWVKEFAR